MFQMRMLEGDSIALLWSGSSKMKIFLPSVEAHLQRLIRDGAVCLNSKKAAKSKTLRGGDIVTIEFREPEKLEVVAEDIP